MEHPPAAEESLRVDLPAIRCVESGITLAKRPAGPAGSPPCPATSHSNESRDLQLFEQNSYNEGGHPPVDTRSQASENVALDHMVIAVMTDSLQRLNDLTEDELIELLTELERIKGRAEEALLRRISQARRGTAEPQQPDILKHWRLPEITPHPAGQHQQIT